MPAGATPKQGDHVFNGVEEAIMRPFESIRSLHSAVIDGQHFLYDYLLHSYSIARKMTDTPTLLLARTLIASAGAEENAFRELTKLRARYPALVRVSPAFLREIHLNNAATYGSASKRFEREFLAAVQQALAGALAPKTGEPAGERTATPGIACQQMLGAAYDPAAALVVVAESMSRETPPLQAQFHSVIAAIADTLDRPAMWKDPYAGFREDRSSTTGKLISDIRNVLTRIDLLKAQSSTFTALIQGELSQKSGSMNTDAVFGVMLHLLYTKLQQMGGTGA